MTAAHDQTSWPAQLLLKEPGTGRRYTADAIPIGQEPDLERDIGACCYLDDLAHPRYSVDGIERPDFNPAIPADLLASGGTWIGGWLTHYNVPPPKGAGLSIGMPRESLEEIWSAARKCDAARIAYQAAVAEAEQKKADAQAKAAAKKPKRQKATPTPDDIAMDWLRANGYSVEIVGPVNPRVKADKMGSDSGWHRTLPEVVEALKAAAPPTVVGRGKDTKPVADQLAMW
jgi:hypothetical protein